MTDQPLSNECEEKIDESQLPEYVIDKDVRVMVKQREKILEYKNELELLTNRIEADAKVIANLTTMLHVMIQLAEGKDAVPEYPGHFPRTRALADARLALQGKPLKFINKSEESTIVDQSRETGV